jgi:orotate phosphoribosyltransferase
MTGWSRGSTALTPPNAHTTFSPGMEPTRLPALKDSIVAMVARWGYDYCETPFRLSSGEESHDYIDGKRALSRGERLLDVGRAILELADGVEFDAVGGLTMGADPLAMAVAIAGNKLWFSVRKEAKAHGKQRLIEGAELEKGMPVMLVDDVATTGRSILQALDALDGDEARGRLEARGIRYQPIMTYRDLGIEPVGRGRSDA